MISLERVLTVIAGGIPDRVPTDLHNFLMAAKMAGIPLAECLSSGELMAESQLLAWTKFGHDALLVESGTTAMAEAMGCGIVLHKSMAPRVAEPVLKSLDDVDKLRIPDPEKDFPLCEVIKAIKILKAEVGDKVFIMGRADQAPVALAAAIRGHEQFLYDLGLCQDPTVIMRLLDKCRKAITRYAFALRDAGAHGTCIGELGSDSISPAMYRQYALPHLRKLFSDFNATDFPGALHQCGNSVQVLPEMVATGASILELDVTTDMRAAKNSTRGRTTVLGMVDPANVLHRGNPALVEEKCREAIGIMAPGGGFILGPGCALVPEVPEENVMALIESAKKYGVYNSDGTLESSSVLEEIVLL